MVVPESSAVVQPGESGALAALAALGESPQEEPDSAGAELEEVRKLQELVRRLEVQNQTLRNRGGKGLLGGGANGNDRTLAEDEDAAADEPDGPQDNAAFAGREPRDDSSSSGGSSGDASPLEAGPPCGAFLDPPCAAYLDPPSPGAGPQDGPGPGPLDQSALDQVEVLDLEECEEAEDEDSWLYVSPKKQALAEQREESPMKWCRKVLDHPTPETEVACRTLISRLDQTTRWRNLYSSPTQGLEAGSSSSAALHSPGHHKSTNKTVLTCGSSGYGNAPSALSSQSSIDSELSTSDDSISMGYKLQDLTDVQIMARLQEESLRQDYASSSASVSRRSSSASLQSLRRGGTYSDQEFDRYSLEDEEDDCCSLAQRLQRYSPSPLSSPRSPRCQSPSAPAQRPRPPRRSLQGPGPELLKFAKSEEELRHSMPNLAPRTSLRSLEAVRNSRSMEANLQSPANRMSRLPHTNTGASSGRIRGNGQSPLSLRAPVKAMGPMAGVRQPLRGPATGATQAGSGGAVRRVQSPGPSNGGAPPAGRAAAAAGSGKQTPGRARTSLGGPGPAQRGRLGQPARRSMGWTKSCSPVTDESWKDGCY